MRTTSASIVVLIFSLAAVVAVEGQGGMRHRGMRHGEAAPVSMARHHLVHASGIDSRYVGKTRPGQPTAVDVESGAMLFERHCAACHGAAGLGDGEAGAALSPRPSNLAWVIGRPIATDAYLFWTIAEGGAPVDSAMPPFATTLDEVEIWQLIAHLRTLK